LYNGIKSTAPENILIANKIYKDEFLKGNVKRAYEYAAGMTKRRVIIEVVVARKKLLKIYRGNIGTVFHISL